MKKRTIYPTQSQELLTLFEQEGTSVKVLCVAIDYKGGWFHNNFE